MAPDIFGFSYLFSPSIDIITETVWCTVYLLVWLHLAQSVVWHAQSVGWLKWKLWRPLLISWCYDPEKVVLGWCWRFVDSYSKDSTIDVGVFVTLNTVSTYNAIYRRDHGCTEIKYLLSCTACHVLFKTKRSACVNSSTLVLNLLGTLTGWNAFGLSSKPFIVRK